LQMPHSGLGRRLSSTGFAPSTVTSFTQRCHTGKSWLGARASRHHHTLHKDHHDLFDRVSVGWKGIILLEAPPRTINYTKQRAYNADVFKTSTYSKGFCTRERSTRPSNRRRFARRVTSIARMVNLIGTSLNLT
jgi:hypothetical protein